jgi:hypothetical protein
MSKGKPPCRWCLGSGTLDVLDGRGLPAGTEPCPGCDPEHAALSLLRWLAEAAANPAPQADPGEHR